MTAIIIFFTIYFVVGILALLYGKRMVNFLLAVFAFLATYRFVIANFQNVNFVLWLAIGAGVLAIFVIMFAKDLAFFLMGGMIGFFLSQLLLQFLPPHPEYMTYIFIGVLVLVCAFLMKHYSVTLIRYGTAYVGGELISTALFFLFTSANSISSYESTDFGAVFQSLATALTQGFSTQYYWMILAMALVLMMIGAAYQRKH